MEFSPTDARRIFDAVLREPGRATCRVAAYVVRHSAVCSELASSLALEARRAKPGAAAMAAALLEQGVPEGVMALVADPLPQIRARGLDALQMAAADLPENSPLRRMASEDAIPLLAARPAAFTLAPLERTLLQCFLGDTSTADTSQLVQVLLESPEALARRHASLALAARGEVATTALIPHLERHRPAPTSELLTLLGELRDPRFLSYLKPLLRDESGDAIAVVAKIPGRKALSLLLDALLHATEYSLRGVLDALRTRRDRDVAFIIDVFQRHPALRANHAALLAELGGPAAAPLLIASLEDSRRAVRAGALEGFRILGKQAVPSLLAVLDDANEELQVTVLGVLAAARDDRGAPAVVRLLQSARSRVQEAAAYALSSLSTEDVIRVAIEVITSGRVEMRRELVRGVRHHRNITLAPVIGVAFSDADESVREAATEAAVILLRHERGRRVTRDLIELHVTGLAARAKLNDLVEQIRCDEASIQHTLVAGSVRLCYELDEAVQAQAFPEITPRPSAPIGEAVWFAVTAPPVVEPDSAVVIDVWAHGRGDHREVLRRARLGFAGRPMLHKSAGPVRVRGDAEMSVTLSVPDLGVLNVSEMLWWIGEIANCSFGITVPRTAKPGSYMGRADVYITGVRIATLAFQLEVAAVRDPQPLDVTTAVTRLRTAFASYASEDRQTVLSRIQGMLSVMPDLDVFLDVMSLRSGDRWLERLQSEITSRDAFYLFWSLAASRSEWVRREWQLALELRGLDHISPVPLASPHTVPPPTELASLHFNSWTLSVS